MFSYEMLPAEYLPDEYDGPHAGTIQEITGMFLCRPFFV